MSSPAAFQLAQPSQDSRLPRYVALRNDLARRIADGGWNLADPIPSEIKLAKQYGVALGTMRRAVEELVREGVLDRRHGSGTFIRRSDFSGSLSRFLRFRSSHSTIAFQESQVLAARLEPAPLEAARRFGLPDGASAIYLDRRRYHGGDLLVAEDIWLRPDRFGPILTLPLDRVGPLLYRTYEDQCGQIISRAEESLRVATATADVATILGVAPDTAIVVIDRTSFGFDGEALEWRRSHASADHFEYRIEIR